MSDYGKIMDNLRISLTEKIPYFFHEKIKNHISGHDS